MTREKLINYTWFVVLAILLMVGMSTYHKLQLANASHQQLLVENQQRLELQAIQLYDAKQQRGMLPPTRDLDEKELPEEK